MFTAFLFTMVEPTASGVFCNRMLSMVNSEDVNAIIQAQRHMCVLVWGFDSTFKMQNSPVDAYCIL